jgi:hypothetical protein
MVWATIASPNSYVVQIANNVKHTRTRRMKLRQGHGRNFLPICETFPSKILRVQEALFSGYSRKDIA